MKLCLMRSCRSIFLELRVRKKLEKCKIWKKVVKEKSLENIDFPGFFWSKKIFWIKT